MRRVINFIFISAKFVAFKYILLVQLLLLYLLVFKASISIRCASCISKLTFGFFHGYLWRLLLVLLNLLLLLLLLFWNKLIREWLALWLWILVIRMNRFWAWFFIFVLFLLLCVIFFIHFKLWNYTIVLSTVASRRFTTVLFYTFKEKTRWAFCVRLMGEMPVSEGSCILFGINISILKITVVDIYIIP